MSTVGATTHKDPMIGRHLGNFEVESLIGRGGSGEVYRAVDARLRRKVESDPKQPRYLQTVRGAGYAFDETFGKI